MLSQSILTAILFYVILFEKEVPCMESRTSIKLPDELKELIKKEAEKQHRSIHNMIITILWEYFSEK
jgi:hypothetical protein